MFFLIRGRTYSAARLIRSAAVTSVRVESRYAELNRTIRTRL
jgi:hypothetical protein